MWLIALVKWWVKVLLLVVAALIGMGRGYWYVRERLPSRRKRRNKQRAMSDRFNRERYQASEEVSGE